MPCQLLFSSLEIRFTFIPLMFKAQIHELWFWWYPIIWGHVFWCWKFWISGSYISEVDQVVSRNWSTVQKEASYKYVQQIPPLAVDVGVWSSWAQLFHWQTIRSIRYGRGRGRGLWSVSTESSCWCCCCCFTLVWIVDLTSQACNVW